MHIMFACVYFHLQLRNGNYQNIIGLARYPYLQKILKHFHVRGTRQHVSTKAFMHCGLPKNGTSYYVDWHGFACRSQIAPPFTHLTVMVTLQNIAHGFQDGT